MIPSFIIGFVVGACVMLFVINEILPSGSLQIDQRERPFVFRFNFDKDFDEIIGRRSIVLKVDDQWHADRDKYIHNITEKDLEDAPEDTAHI